MKIDIKDVLSSKNEIVIDSEGLYYANYKLENTDSVILRNKFIFQKPGVEADIKVKVILLDDSKFDFEGLLKIEKGAIDVNTYLKIDCLLIGKNASARAVPSLEINEDSVKAGHGATIGTIDQTQLNYLMQKGLSKVKATEILIEAFFIQ